MHHLFSADELSVLVDAQTSVTQTVDAKWSHTKPESPVRQARTALDLNQGVPVNLTCKFTRKQQTVKYESVSAGIPNNSDASYRQGSADIENDNKSGMKSVY